MSFRAVVLAAGKGTRMRSDLPKVLHTVLGRPLVAFPVDLALELGADEVAVVVGHGRERVEACVRERWPGKPVSTWVQERMLGTADAVRAALPFFRDRAGCVLLLMGDVPNVPRGLLTELLALHRSGRSPIALVTALAPGETDYGRIVRDERGAVHRIVEFRDCDATTAAIREVNMGIYAADSAFLAEALQRPPRENAQREFYLTDLIEFAWQSGRPAAALVAPDIEALHGVNDPEQLARAERFAMAHADDQSRQQQQQ